ncbi:MAG: hypothetical protein AB1465_03085 [Patescibacteria group bacterium]
MKKKIAKILAGCMVAIFTFTLSGGFYFAKADEITTIKLDGQFDDWQDVPTLLTHTESWYPNFMGQIYYWNNDTNVWQTEELPNACMYNEGRSLDLGKIKFANDANYLYFYWEKNSDYTNFFWKTFPNDPNNYTIDEQSFLSDPVTKLDPVSQSSPPCLGETIFLPVYFNHDKVFAFDTNLDGKFDYYLVLNINIPQGTQSASMDTTVTSLIYQDDGNGIYDDRDTETLVTNLGTDFTMEVSATPCQNGVCQEGKIKINEFFTDLGIKWGSTIWTAYESHSGSKLFSTAKALYSFNKNNKLGLKITSPKKKSVTTKKKSIVFKGRIKKESKITVYRNKKKVYQSSKFKGKFSELVPLKKGTNIIIVKAQKGRQKVTKGVVVKRKK